jgi:hypothetical protein
MMHLNSPEAIQVPAAASWANIAAIAPALFSTTVLIAKGSRAFTL